MLGYVKAESPELKVKDFETYKGYYCGVCKSIGKNHGQLPRMGLSYDAAFLASLLDGLDNNPVKYSREHCIIHRIKKMPIVRSQAVDYAADVMLLLGYHKLEDDFIDEKKKAAKVGTKLLKRIYKELSSKYPKLDKEIKYQLESLHNLEENKETSLDKVADSSAKIIEEIFAYYFENVDDVKVKSENELAAIRKLGYMLGKWIYLIDAIDDLDKDVMKNRYNPFIYKLGIEKGNYLENSEPYRLEVADMGQRNLFLYGSDLVDCLEELVFLKNEDIVDNILSLGLLRRAETVVSELKDPKLKAENKKKSKGGITKIKS